MAEHKTGILRPSSALAQCAEHTNEQEFRQYVEKMYEVQVELTQPKGMGYEDIE